MYQLVGTMSDGGPTSIFHGLLSTLICSMSFWSVRHLGVGQC